jgi:hypothetical protein
MKDHRKLTTKEVALTTTFTALYALLSILKISPIIGLFGQAITAATILAPIMGIILGAYTGALTAFLGGTVTLLLGFLSYPSFASGITAAFCAGMIKKGEKIFSTLIYLSLLLIFAFYPHVGPAWLFPQVTWFQAAGLIILISPLGSAAAKSLSSRNNSNIILGFFLISLTSTLGGQIAGSLVFEILVPDPTFMTATWQTLTLLYPIERTIIALEATVIGISLLRVLKTAKLSL